MVNSIQGKHLEKICEYLNCEPNDLYEWKPAKDAQSPENHPLKAVRRDDKAEQFRARIRDLPFGKIAEAEALLAGLTSTE